MPTTIKLMPQQDLHKLLQEIIIIKKKVYLNKYISI